jgi:beta-glucanase (GH16 family)
MAYIDDFLYSGAISTCTNLVWSDEFSTNGVVNNLNWFHQTQLPNGTSWYNGELQHYTNSQTNSYCSNGILSITAKKQTLTQQNQTKQYTSARLNSKFAFKYGRVEVRAKLPTGAGTWPAIWMLGKNIIEPGGYWTASHGTTSWPACGEIDIMEHWGTNQNVISSAVHHPINGNLSIGEYTTNSQYKAGVSNNFHIYAMEWNEQSITFSVDGVNHLIYNPTIKNQYTWPFDAEQYILLNVAMLPDAAAAFTQSTMEIDYVRVYQQTTLDIKNVPTKVKNATNAIDLAIYPNPIKDKLNVIINENQIGNRATVYSLLGQELNSYVLNNKKTIVDVSAYKKGIYFLKVETSSGMKSYNFIKE